MLENPPILITAADYRQLPEGPPYFQLIEGKLYMSPSPDFWHQSVSLNVAVLLRNYVKRNPVGRVCAAPSDVELDFANIYQPDVYFIANDRLHILSKQGPVGAPNLVVEVLSRSTARLDKGAKRRIYAQAGVEELWLVDKEKRVVTVYRFGKSVDELAGVYNMRQKFTSPLLPRLKVAVAEVFER